MSETDTPEDDPVVTAIFDVLGERKSAAPRDVAEKLAAAHRRPGDGRDAWRRYMNSVKQQAVGLARRGQIEIVRKGKVVDPNDFKGIVRYRLPSPPEC